MGGPNTEHITLNTVLHFTVASHKAVGVATGSGTKSGNGIFEVIGLIQGVCLPFPLTSYEIVIRWCDLCFNYTAIDV